MATLTPIDITRAGVTVTLAAAAAGGDAFPNDGNVFFEIDNAAVGSMNVTFVTQKTVDGFAVADDTVAVGPSARKKFGPFPPSIYNDANGLVQVTYSAVTTVTVAAYRAP